MSRPRHGFTLIELLIVVAIIAILAAIAVPNFLEAQVRSKVSRVKSDMRSMATAIEAYAVDNNSYCLAFRYAAGQQDIPVSSVWVQHAVRRLTTPVAYMSSIPDDPFIPSSQKEMPGAGIPIPTEGRQVPSFVWQYHGRYAGGIMHSDFEAYYYGPERGMNDQGYYPSFKLCVGRYSDRMWILVSQGVNYKKASNQITQSRTVDWKMMPYDSTNGTVSAGHIVRSGP